MHWDRILRNVFSNGTSYLVTAVVGFMLTPVIVHSLGNVGYGLWTLVVSMAGYFGLLDLGIRSSVGRFVTRYVALNEQQNVNRTASTAFVILMLGGALAFLCTLAIVTFFFDFIQLEPQQASAGRSALLIAGLNIALVLPLGVFSAVLIALERFDVVSGVTVGAELARAVLVLWCLQQGYGLVGLALTALAITIVQYSAMAFFAKAVYTPLQLSIRYVNWAACRELFGFSVYRFIWIVANQLIFYSDALVIGIYLGAAAVTPYAIAGSLIIYGRTIVSLVTDTLYPIAAQMDAKADQPGLQRLLILGTRMALLMTLPLCLGFLFLGRQFITLWMGPAYADSAVILMVLTISQFGSMSQSASALVLAGMAKHRAFAYFALAEGVANVILSVILVQRMGLIGVAWGTVIPSLVCTTLVVPLYTLHVLRMNVTDYLLKAYLRPILCALPVAALGYIFSMAQATSWLRFAAESMAICGVFGGMSYFLCLYSDQRAALAARLSAVFRRAPATNEI